MENYLQKGHTLYMDNYYNSVDLAEYLLSNKTTMCGTLRTNRKRNPSYVIKSKLTQGTRAWRRNAKGVVVLKWKDKRDVLMISTKHNADIVNTTSKKGLSILKPKMVHDYNKNMSGIDRSDQMVSYYACPRRSIRWYMKVFFHLIDISLWNACWIYNKINVENPLTLLSFREKIIKAYLGKPPRQRLSVDVTASTSTAAHFPDMTSSRKRCRQCSKNKKRTATKYICGVCRDKDGDVIGLCPYPCFRDWHIQ